MGKKGEMSLLSLGILGLLEKLTWPPHCFGSLVSFPRQLLHAAWSACPRVNLNKWVIPRKDFWPPSPPNCGAFANHIRTSASSEWGWKSCKNMFPRGWFWDFLPLVSAKTWRDEAEGGLERQREGHFTGGRSPLLAKDSIRVWWSSHWLLFTLNPFYHSIIYKELCFVVRLPKIQPTASLCLNQNWNIQARWWGMGPALVLGCSTVTFPGLYKHPPPSLETGRLPGCEYAAAIPSRVGQRCRFGLTQTPQSTFQMFWVR